MAATPGRLSTWKQMIGSRLTALLTGGLALLGIAQSIREAFEPRVQEQFNLYRLLPKWPAWSWVVLVLGVLLVVLAEGAYRSARDLNLQVEHLRADLEASKQDALPKLTFELDHPSCSMEEAEADEPFEVHRLVLLNSSSVQVTDVRIQLVDLKPMPATLRGKLPLPLHPMHATDGGATFSLAPGERKLMDVFEFSYSDVIGLCHAVPHVPREIALGCYSVTFEALGANTARSVATVDIQQGEGNEIWLQFPQV